MFVYIYIYNHCGSRAILGLHVNGLKSYFLFVVRLYWWKMLSFFGTYALDISSLTSSIKYISEKYKCLRLCWLLLCLRAGDTRWPEASWFLVVHPQSRLWEDSRTPWGNFFRLKKSLEFRGERSRSIVLVVWSYRKWDSWDTNHPRLSGDSFQEFVPVWFLLFLILLWIWRNYLPSTWRQWFHQSEEGRSLVWGGVRGARSLSWLLSWVENLIERTNITSVRAGFRQSPRQQLSGDLLLLLVFCLCFIWWLWRV